MVVLRRDLADDVRLFAALVEAAVKRRGLR